MTGTHEERAVVSQSVRIVRRLVPALATVALVAGLAACGPYDRHGSCRDYEPVDYCEYDMVYVCDESRSGCNQCSCVSREEARKMR
jgi:hypothetical protein